MPKPRMHLGYDFSSSRMAGRWLMPGAWPGHTFPDTEMFEEMARIAERGMLDLLFPGDGTGMTGIGGDCHPRPLSCVSRNTYRLGRDTGQCRSAIRPCQPAAPPATIIFPQ